MAAYNPFTKHSESPQLEAVEDSLRDVEQGALLDDLADYVRERFCEARKHRNSLGIEDDMICARLAMKNQYTPEERVLLKDQPDIYMGITNVKVRAAKAWVVDILANAEDKPWTIKATPLPELPDEAEQAVIQRLQQDIQKNGFTFDMNARAKQLKGLAQRFVDKVASETSERMETKIADQMSEAGWRTVLDEFTTDLMMYPAAVVKGPFLTREASLRWNGNELAAVNRIVRKVERVDPYDIFPSANSTTTQDGAYLIQRVKANKTEMMSYATMAGFNAINIRAMLSEGEYCRRVDYFGSNTRDVLDGLDPDAAAPDTEYEIACYYGQVPVELLQSHGIAQEMDPQANAEAEVWVVDGWVIRAILNPHPLGRRPFHATSFSRVPGQFWGQSLPVLLKDVQRVCNACARAMVKNAGYSAGPIGEYDVDRLDQEEDVAEVQPYRMYATNNSRLLAGQNAPAFRFQIVPSVADQLMNLFNFFTRLADDYSGIPAYVMGQPQVSGAGRTLGGLSMLLGNAAKGIKAVIANVDKYITEPVVTAFYELEMLFGEDMTLKADVKVVARGSSGILQRELSQSRATEVLQMLSPYATGQTPIVEVDALRVVLRDVLRSLGYSADELIPDPETRQQYADVFGVPGQLPMVGGQGGAGQQISMPPTSSRVGTPPPSLDGRSAAPQSSGDVANLPG